MYERHLQDCENCKWVQHRESIKGALLIVEQDLKHITTICHDGKAWFRLIRRRGKIHQGTAFETYPRERERGRAEREDDEN